MIPVEKWGTRREASSWTAENATLVGQVTLGPESSIWYGAVLRGDGAPILVGPRSNVQDACVVHADPGLPVRIGAGVSVGHRAVLHGCVVEDDVLIGMGAIVMDGAVIGSGSIVAAGALVPEGSVIPPSSLVVGVPGRVRRPLTDDELAGNRANAETYVELAAAHMSR